MKLRVNLAGKKKGSVATRILITRSFVTIFSLIAVSFIVYFGFGLYKTFNIKSQIESVKAESVLVSSEIRSKDNVVNNFVLSKAILDQIATLNRNRFQYKRYMDEIVAIMPPEAVLRNVDFQVKGWVAVLVYIPDLKASKKMEERVHDKTIVDQTVFSSVFSESLVKDKSGGYLVKMQFELKKNG